MITAVYAYVQFVSTWLNQVIIDGFYLGLTAATTYPSGQTVIQYLADEIGSQIYSGDYESWVTQYLALGVSSDLKLTGINVYCKGDVGTTVAQNKRIVSKNGTRIGTGQGDPLPPQTTFSVYFPCQSYGQKGCKWGLPGVYEADQVSGLVSGSSFGATVANDLSNLYEAGIMVSNVTDDFTFMPAKVSRIEYTTPGGKQAYRMPYGSGDEPVVYTVGNGSVNPVLGTNNHRKPGRGI